MENTATSVPASRSSRPPDCQFYNGTIFTNFTVLRMSMFPCVHSCCDSMRRLLAIRKVTNDAAAVESATTVSEASGYDTKPTVRLNAQSTNFKESTMNK